MVFIASGMAAEQVQALHVIAKAAREMNIDSRKLQPYLLRRRVQENEKSSSRIRRIKKHLDTTIVVPNQNLFKIANETTGF